MLGIFRLNGLMLTQEELIEEGNRIIQEFQKHIGKEVCVIGKNMTWRNLEGEKTFTLNKPIDIFEQIAPQTDLTFYIWKKNDNEYEIKLSHHDSPMGENYYINIKN